MSANEVRVLDLTTGTDTGIAIPVGVLPHGIAITPDGTKVFNGNLNSGTVSVIDTATNTVTATITVGSGPIAVFVTRDGANVFVANNDAATISKIDVATNSVVDTIALPGSHQPNGFDESPDGQWLYSADSAFGDIDVIRLSDDTVTTATVASSATGVAFAPDGQSAWALDATNNVAVRLDLTVPSSPHPISAVSVGSAPATLVPFMGPT